MIDTIELVGLLIAIAALPAIALVARQVRVPAGRAELFVAYAAILAAWAFRVAGNTPQAPAEGLDLARHVCYLVSGLAFCAAAWGVRREVIREIGK